MDTIAGMRVFVQVVSQGSFSAAGRQLDLAPSSVSRRIRELEDELGSPLFHRTTRKLSLTEAGQVYYDKAANIIMEVDEARLAVAELGSPSGILRITTPAGIGRELVVSVLPGFLKRYPGIKIVMSMTDAMVDIVAGGIDVAIRLGQLSDSSLKARKIGESQRIVCASPDYLKKHGTPKTPENLAEHSCVIWRDHPGSNVWRFRGPYGQREVRVTGNFFAKNADAMVAAAVAGLGFVLLPDWNLGIELRRKELKTVLKNYNPMPSNSPIWAVHSHQRHVPPKIRAFTDYLAKQFSTRKRRKQSA